MRRAHDGERPKKEREKEKTMKETVQWQTGYSKRPPTSSDHNLILHAVRLCDVVS